jgi:hypothetical protein
VRAPADGSSDRPCADHPFSALGLSSSAAVTPFLYGYLVDSVRAHEFTTRVLRMRCSASSVCIWPIMRARIKSTTPFGLTRASAEVTDWMRRELTDRARWRRRIALVFLRTGRKGVV